MPEKRVTVTTTRVQLVASNENRSAMIFHNRGTDELFISRDKTNIVSQGFPVPSGAFFSYLAVDGDDAVTAVYGITAAGSANVGISESFEQVPVKEIAKFIREGS